MRSCVPITASAPAQGTALRTQSLHILAADWRWLDLIYVTWGHTTLGPSRHDPPLNALSPCVLLLQTGAGKTYTMSGEAQQYARRGIVPRALHQLFQEVELRVDRSYEVKVSFLEIYNEVGQRCSCSV